MQLDWGLRTRLCAAAPGLALALVVVASAPAAAAVHSTSPNSDTLFPHTNPPLAGVSPSVGPTVVLADFDNKTHDSLFDRSLTQALLLEIGQSPFMSVLSERSLTDALRAINRPVSAPITPSVARQVCLRSGSEEVLDGSIGLAPSEPHYEIELKAIDCNSGATVAEERGDATARKDVLQVLHKASANLRMRIGEPLASVRKFNVSAEATTKSLGALSDYSLGLIVRRESGDVPSIQFFKRSLAHDGSFPMALAILAGIYGNLRQPSVAIGYATKAYESRDRVGERERFHIAGVYFLATGQMQQEIRNYELWQTEYPGDSVPYNNLGNDYAALGQLNESLHEYQAALRLTPSVVSYTNVAGMELALNRLDDAGATLDAAFARQLDGRYLHQTLYWLAFLRGNAPQMARQVAWSTGKAGDEDPLLSMQSDTEAYYGRLRKARELSRQAVRSAVDANSKETAAFWQVNEALREAEIGNAASAEEDVASALGLSRGRDVELLAAFALARAGYRTQAAELLRTIEKSYPTDSLLRLYWLPAIRAAVELDGGNTLAALADLKLVLPYELGGAGTFINYLYPAYVRGLTYLQAHDGQSACVEFHKVLEHRGIVVNFVTGALAHLQLGRAYAMAGDVARAKVAYHDFFTLWEGADPDVPVLLQAKSQYARFE